VEAFKKVDMSIPVVVRLQGTNAEKAADIIKNSGLSDKIIMMQEFAAAAEKAVKVAQG
jgi:succinyl-CoA synthetase beta subunit